LRLATGILLLEVGAQTSSQAAYILADPEGCNATFRENNNLTTLNR
jgi:hypothetical protein